MDISLGTLGPVDSENVSHPFHLLIYGKALQHLSVMQEGYFLGMFIKNVCMSPSLLTVRSSPSSSWMLLLAHGFVPKDFRREGSETDSTVFTVSQLLTYMGHFPHFSPLSLLFQIG